MSRARQELPALPDIPALLNVFVQHRVSFLVIGGAAVAHHGFVRATKDLDVIPSPDADNLARLHNALMESRHSRLPSKTFVRRSFQCR
jgi:hypothetical protein